MKTSAKHFGLVVVP